MEIQNRWARREALSGREIGHKRIRNMVVCNGSLAGYTSDQQTEESIYHSKQMDFTASENRLALEGKI